MNQCLEKFSMLVQNQPQVVQTGGAGGVQTITVGGGQQVQQILFSIFLIVIF
jgi:hypothetical protein